MIVAWRVTELGLRISTTTNGTPLASAEVRAHIAGCYDELTVSACAGLSHGPVVPDGLGTTAALTFAGPTMQTHPARTRVDRWNQG